MCDDGIQKKLEEVGAVCIGQCEFQDRYYDSADFHLTLRDVWLRCRKGCWELKCPTVKKAENSAEEQEATLCSRYMEITNLSQIQLKVGEIMTACLREQQNGCQNHSVVQQEAAMTEDSETTPIDSWLKELSLVCFANFTTVRCSFSFKEEGVRVDLDQADFGYSVGEIEVLVPEGEDVQPALRKIEKTAQKLGLSGDERVRGKMDVFLQNHYPEHYAKLLKAHIL